MTERDLRFAFHMDTGSLAMWAQGKWQCKDLYNGHPGSEYGQWLEDKAGNGRWLRRAFQFEHHTAPTYQSTFAIKFAGWSWRAQEVFWAPYIYWLEERVLRDKPEVIQNILHI